MQLENFSALLILLRLYLFEYLCQLSASEPHLQAWDFGQPDPHFFLWLLLLHHLDARRREFDLKLCHNKLKECLKIWEMDASIPLITTSFRSSVKIILNPVNCEHYYLKTLKSSQSTASRRKSWKKCKWYFVFKIVLT